MWPNIFCGMVSHALGPKTTSNILHKLWPSAVDYNNEISACFTQTDRAETYVSKLILIDQ